MKLFIFAVLASLSTSLCATSRILEMVSFGTADGGTIHADYYPAGGTMAVVLAHGAIFNKASWHELAGQLSANEIGVLAIDFRGYGQSIGGGRPNDRFQDILAAVRYLHRQKNIEQVAALGASMGGGAAGTAAVHAQKGEISRLLLLSPVSIANPEKIKAGKILYIASEKEAGIKSIKTQYQRAPSPKRLELLPGKAHAQHIFNTKEKSALTATIIEFLREQ